MSAQRRLGNKDLAWCVGVAAFAALPTLGHQPLSWNEAVTLGAAQRSPSELWALLRHTDAPLGLYYLIIHVWLMMLSWIGIGADAFWLRLPSALAAVAAVALVAAIVSRTFDRRVALVAATVLAVHPMLTFYAQDARPYALVTLSFVAATAALIGALQRPSAVRMAAYVGLATTTIYLHLFSMYGFVAHLYLIVRLTMPGQRRRWVMAASALGAAIAPIAILATSQQAEVGWIPHPTPRIVASVVVNVFGGVTLVAAALALGLAALHERGFRRPDSRVTFLLFVALTPVLILVALDLVVPDLVARYALISVPAFATLIALAAVRTPSRVGRGLVIAVVSIALITTAVQQSRPFKYENYQQAADVMGDSAVPGSTVMFLPISTRAGFQPYRHLEPDLAGVSDAAAARPIADTDQIGGTDQPREHPDAAFRPLPGDLRPWSKHHASRPRSAWRHGCGPTGGAEGLPDCPRSTIGRPIPDRAGTQKAGRHLAFEGYFL